MLALDSFVPSAQILRDLKGDYLGHSLFKNKEVEMTTGPGAVPRLGDPAV